LRAVGPRSERARIVIVGAGRSGRALARELAETPDRRVVGFLDDNPRVRRRRVLGIKVLGGLDEAAAHLRALRPDEVLVTIPNVGAERLQQVVTASDEAGVVCRIVRRTTEATQPPPLVEMPAE
jgi:FlaA1/EpsC-like NDP-sugar epimerase